MCVSSFVFGSYTARCRPAFAIGWSLADGCVEPSLQKSGLAAGRTADVSHTRPFSSNIGLWTLFLLVQITSSSKYGEGNGMFGDVGGVFGSRTVSGTLLVVCRTGSSTGMIVRAQLERSVDEAVGVERRIAPIGGHFVVQVGLRIRPVPLRDDDVALESLRTRRRGRHLAAGDAVRPVGKHRVDAILAHVVHAARHLRAGLTRLNAALPGRGGAVERAEILRHLARALRAELMTGGAPARLQHAEELGLRLHVRRDAVAARSVAGKFAFLGDAHQGEPVAGGVVLRRGARARRDDRRQIDRLARRTLHFR